VQDPAAAVIGEQAIFTLSMTSAGGIRGIPAGGAAVITFKAQGATVFSISGQLQVGSAGTANTVISSLPLGALTYTVCYDGAGDSFFAAACSTADSNIISISSAPTAVTASFVPVQSRRCDWRPASAC